MFGKINNGDRCPRCQQGLMRRCRRQDWMRRLPRSKYYKCADCQARFLSVYGFAIPLRPGVKKIRDPGKVEAP